jgi:hypothetical protein
MFYGDDLQFHSIVLKERVQLEMAKPMNAYTREEEQSASLIPTSNHSLSRHSIELIELHLGKVLLL